MPNTDNQRKVRLSYGGLTALAKKTGYDAGHLSRYFAGHRKSKRLDALMVGLFGVPGSEIEVVRTRATEPEPDDTSDVEAAA